MKKNTLIYYLIILLPFIDITTAIITRNTEIFITPGILIKMLLMIYLVIYSIITKSKYKKLSLSIIFLCCLYTILYFSLNTELLSSNYILKELQYTFKLIFFPICFSGLLCYFDDYELINKIPKLLIYTIIIYSLLIIIPVIFKFSYTTYPERLKGYVGLFYSGNQLSNIFILLLPMIYLYINKSKTSFLILLPVYYICLMIGTKVASVGAIIISILAVIYYMLKKNGRSIILSIIISLFVILSTSSGYTSSNYKITSSYEYIENNETQYVTSSQNEQVKIINKKINNIYKKNNLISKLKPLLNGRDMIFANTLSISLNNKNNFLFGIGYSNTNKINNPMIEKLIEIDYLDAYFHNGLIGLILMMIPYFICCAVFIKYIKRFNTNTLFGGLLLGLVLGISSLSGHTFMSPSVSIYIILIMILFINTLSKFEKKPLDYNKIQILALHLKEGGIETVLTNQANMLSNKYNIEIVSVYNTKKTIPYKLNKNIKVTYLINDISNREYLKDALRSKNVIKILHEGFKSIKILYLKYALLRNNILNSNAGTIISTRSEFSKLLGKYKRDGVITIAEEHVYHNNDKKRINCTINGNKYIDYLLPTSKEMVGFYQPLVNSEVVYIKNVINEYPKDINKLNNKKLIAIGRLSKEKGFIDLIPIMKEIVKQDNKVTLDIYGEGSEKEKILEAIKNNNLDKNINIKNFVPLKKLNKLRKDYSLMVIPSYEESFGLAALESMTYGIPCVIYDDAKGLQEFVSEDNGVIINNRDYKKFAKEILNLLNNQKKLKKLGANARKKSEEYNIKTVEKEFIEFINNAIEKQKKNKVLFISSTGGHLNELLQLKTLFNKYNYLLVTEKETNNLNLRNKYYNHVHYIIPGTYTGLKNKILYPFKLIGNCFISLYYLIKYNPDVIVTTGAHNAGPMCLIGKIMGKKVIFIETFANSNSPTKCGKIVYKFADVFIVQWESMKEFYPDAVVAGWIF